jgi:hypothetical protein
MHTAICTFEDRRQADDAAERLLQSGFARHEVHVEHRHADGSPMAEAEGGSERRDHDVVGKFSFFERLFGAGRHAPHADTYSSAVERGLYVVLVEAQDEAGAERAQAVLHGMNPGDFTLVHRVGGTPLRDVVAERSGSLEQRFGTARSEMGAGHEREVRQPELFPSERSTVAAPDRPDVAREAEPAVGSMGWGEQRRLEIVDDDKPIASPDLHEPPLGHDKPR